MSTSPIDVVLRELDEVLDDARRRRDRLGWFTALYRQTTRTVQGRVAAGAFDDSERMGRFVARFAARYLEPVRSELRGEAVPRCWRVAFDALHDRDTVILQHLLLGINAHINLDLAVTAAEMCPGPEIDGLHDDFMRINAVLGALMPHVRACVGRFSPLLDVLDRVGGGDDDRVLNFSIGVARDEAWLQARALAAVGQPDLRAAMVDSLDRSVAVLGKLVARPGGLLQRAVDVVAATESDDVVAVMDALGEVVLPAA